MARRGNGEGSIYQRQDGRWVGVLDLGRVGGKRRRKAVYGATQKEVREKLRALQREQATGIDVTAGDRRLDAHLRSWLADMSLRVRPTTVLAYEIAIENRLIPVLGQQTLRGLQASHVQALVHDLRQQGYSPRTIHFTVALLRRALARAVAWGEVARNVALAVTLPPQTKFEPSLMTMAEARAFLAAIQDEPLAALFTVTLVLGLRVGEAAGLCWSDVDEAAGTLRVERQCQRVPGVPGMSLVPLKTAASRRIIPLPAVCLRTLLIHRERQRLAERLGQARPSPEGLVFANPEGRPWDRTTISQHWAKLQARHGLPHRRIHDLRHNAATLLLAQGVHPRVVMAILGHTALTMTLGVYSHVTADMLAEAGERLNAALG